MAQPVHALAGTLADPLAEEILAILFTDQPVREDVRPGDARRHWQWAARQSNGNTSRLWLSYAQPIVDTTVTDIEGRAVSALAGLVPEYARAITVSAQQTAIDEITMIVTISRTGQSDEIVQLVIGGSGGT